MARTTFYYHTKRLAEPDGYDDARTAIRNIYDCHKGRYGYRRITSQLRNDGISLNHKTVQRLMAEMGLYGKRKKARYKSYRVDVGNIAPNVIGRDFAADAPNRKWATDVTEVRIKNKKIYLSPILDMFNGEIVSYTISCRPDLEMAMEMLDKAFKNTHIPEGLILHSDQGWQYQRPKYQKALKDKGIVQSMSRKGNYLDNAMMENFFGIMKSELLYFQEWESVGQFAKELAKYICYYNNDRIKLRLNGKSPVQYRALFLSTGAL